MRRLENQDTNVRYIGKWTWNKLPQQLLSAYLSRVSPLASMVSIPKDDLEAFLF